MGEQIPKKLEICTVIEFRDGEAKYLQTWEGQLDFETGDFINLKGDLGISKCRSGTYEVSTVIPKNQLSVNLNGQDVFYRFYECHRL